ncbi:SRPBCC family protein [Ktedonobacter sp. SOSP1-52]|uniref:SRPBCC family protein n=1 Tax=Ktedonobacter sp. SOSP1-52 TaxID=2778366 RepID=UPI001914FE6C|nr:SRPBCC family protein [Ktedonobacter sp. SOSP1-52]
MMGEHHVTVLVPASVKNVYAFFTHFHDFPKYMHCVREVTYYDSERSHWVVQVAGKQEWDAVNENWIPERQVGWRSTKGLQNRGTVKFTPLGAEQTSVDAFISHIPPMGIVGKIAEWLGIDSHFQTVLEKEMQNFTRMVEEAPRGTADPMVSHYLFHQESAFTRGKTTERQRASMKSDPMMSPEHLHEREIVVASEREEETREKESRRVGMERRKGQMQEAVRAQDEILQRQRVLDQQEMRERHEREDIQKGIKHELDPVRDTLGGRNASMERTAFGDQDARHERFPQHQEGPMTARPLRSQKDEMPKPSEEEEKAESQWKNLIRGRSLEDETK